MKNSDNKFIRRLGFGFLLLQLFLLPGTNLFAQGSIFGAVTNSDVTVPANGEINFFGFLDDTDEEIRIETSVGAGYDNGHWLDDFQNYLTESAGNPYDYIFFNSTNGEGFILSDIIPNNSFQQEDIELAPVSWPEKPLGLEGHSVSATSIQILWEAVAGLTYHIYRRAASSNGSFFRIDDPTGSLASHGISGSTYIDYTVTANGSYHYLIIAEDASANLGPHSDYITVTAQEPEEPVITCPGDITIECSDSSDPDNTGFATATDNIDSEPTITYSDIIGDGDCPQAKTISRTWVATDSDNNSSLCVQTITVADLTAPDITCPDDIAVTFGSSVDPSLTGFATADDLCDASPIIDYSDSQTDNIITRTWTATDACGNSTDCDQKIEIIMHGGPVWYVSVSGNNSNDGSSEYPFATIQKAIDQTVPGDTVLITDGTYTGTGNRDLNPGGKNIIIMSENGPNATIVDCGASAGNPHRGFNIITGENNKMAVIGLTVRNGYVTSEGAGIRCYLSSPRIIDCIFRDNKAGQGGAGLVCLSSSPQITDCRFIDNDADRYGGAIYIAGASSMPEFSDTEFIGNSAGETGGAILINNCLPAFDGCDFSVNTAGNIGGAIGLTSSNAVILGCNFDSNSSGSSGGAIYCDNSSPSIVLTTITGNSAVEFGGAVACQYNSAPEFIKCTLAMNEAPEGGGIFCNISSPSISNCIIAFNLGGGAIYCRDNDSEAQPICTDIFGNIGGDWAGKLAAFKDISGNIEADPYFCDMPNGDFQLSGNSPCLSENNECEAQIGALGKGCDVTTDVDEDNLDQLPTNFQLAQNYPNPFNPATTIRFDLPVKARVTLAVYNILGQQIRMLANETFTAGRHEVVWDGLSNDGRDVASGIYFYRLQAEQFSDRKKMLLLK